MCEGRRADFARRPSSMRCRLGIRFWRRCFGRRRLGGSFSDRAVVLLDVLAIRRRYVARALEQHPRGVAFAETAAQTKLEVLEAFDGLRAKLARGSRVLQVLRVRQLAQALH